MLIFAVIGVLSVWLHSGFLAYRLLNDEDTDIKRWRKWALFIGGLGSLALALIVRLIYFTVFACRCFHIRT